MGSNQREKWDTGWLAKKEPEHRALQLGIRESSDTWTEKLTDTGTWARCIMERIKYPELYAGGPILGCSVCPQCFQIYLYHFSPRQIMRKRKKNSSQTEVIYLVPLAAEIWPLRIFLIIFKICHVIYQSIWNFTMISKMYNFIHLWFDAVKKTIQLNLKILGANRTSYYRKIPEEGDRKKPHKAKEIDNFYSRNW